MEKVQAYMKTKIYHRLHGQIGYRWIYVRAKIDKSGRLHTKQEEIEESKRGPATVLIDLLDETICLDFKEILSWIPEEEWRVRVEAILNNGLTLLTSSDRNQRRFLMKYPKHDVPNGTTV